VEFREDDPASHLTAIADAAERFPTSARYAAAVAMEEATWDALFAAEDEANNNDSNSSIDLGAEAEPDHNSHHSSPRAQDSLALEEEEDEVDEPPAAVLEKVSLQSLNFGFNEGFRMNSDQSLGLSSEPSNGSSTSSGCCIAEEDEQQQQQDTIETSS